MSMIWRDPSDRFLPRYRECLCDHHPLVTIFEPERKKWTRKTDQFSDALDLT